MFSLFDKTSYEPKLHWEVSSILAKSEYQTDCRSFEPLFSTRYFCKHYKMIEIHFNPSNLAFPILFSKILKTSFRWISQCYHNGHSIYAVVAVAFCELQNFGWKRKLPRECSLAKQVSTFAYLILNTKWAREAVISRIDTFERRASVIRLPTTSWEEGRCTYVHGKWDWKYSIRVWLLSRLLYSSYSANALWQSSLQSHVLRPGTTEHRNTH